MSWHDPLLRLTGSHCPLPTTPCRWANYLRQAPHSSGGEERPLLLTTMQQQATDVGSAAAGLGQGAGSGPGAGAENLLQMLTMQDVVHEGGAVLGQGAGSGPGVESDHRPSLMMQDVVREGASDEDLTGKHLRRAMQVGGEKEEVVGEWDGGGGEGNGCNF